MSGQQYIPKQTDEEREARRENSKQRPSGAPSGAGEIIFESMPRAAATTVACATGRACHPDIGDKHDRSTKRIVRRADRRCEK